MSRVFQLVYPEVRKATERELRSMYRDAIADHACDGADSDEIDDVVGALEFAGIITVSTKDLKPTPETDIQED